MLDDIDIRRLSERIVDKLTQDLECRKGLGDEYDAMREDVRLEMTREWESIVEAELHPHMRVPTILRK